MRRIEARIDKTDLDNLERNINTYCARVRKELYDAVEKTTRAVGRSARSRIRNKTGHLKKGIKTRMDRSRNAVGWVDSKGPHSHLIEYGTRPHRLDKGSRKQNEAMKINGDFVKGAVNHPGSKPYPFLRPAYEQETPKLIQEARRILRK